MNKIKCKGIEGYCHGGHGDGEVHLFDGEHLRVDEKLGNKFDINSEFDPNDSIEVSNYRKVWFYTGPEAYFYEWKLIN